MGSPGVAPRAGHRPDSTTQSLSLRNSAYLPIVLHSGTPPPLWRFSRHPLFFFLLTSREFHRFEMGIHSRVSRQTALAPDLLFVPDMGVSRGDGPTT